MRHYPERRTNRQLEVLVIFLLHERQKEGRKKYPTLREIGEQMNPPVTTRKAVLTAFVDPLFDRGDLEPRGIPEFHWRQWQLTDQGRDRAKKRLETVEAHDKRVAKARARKAARDRRNAKRRAEYHAGKVKRPPWAAKHWNPEKHGTWERLRRPSDDAMAG